MILGQHPGLGILGRHPAWSSLYGVGAGRCGGVMSGPMYWWAFAGQRLWRPGSPMLAGSSAAPTVCGKRNAAAWQSAFGNGYSRGRTCSLLEPGRGDALRQHLVQVIRRFAAGSQRPGFSAVGGLFPVQTHPHPLNSARSYTNAYSGSGSGRYCAAVTTVTTVPQLSHDGAPSAQGI